MKPEDPNCPLPLKIHAIRMLYSQIIDIIESIVEEE